MSHILPDQDLDLGVLYEIADGSEEFIIESIDMFLQHTPEMLEAISSAIANKDWPVAASVSHKLKPNLGFFGMPISQATIQEVELMSKAGAPDPELVLSKFNEVQARVQANIITLEKIKADKEAGA
ncbi:HPt (histidine-containing phosphotransfer) domain-containing protein [Mucilaginibacter frigoritolerans]|jgi:HPt (histidine-containing phosphotransfer) domain-containing protein|uniref:HPt (Histidine-containing phosphotransfer) domain-containing protein n=1 Tax=Mucilaginibacter frigoritolerans TaxID=652788 RepID=A0A562UFY2_9SPHI|nr:Hpt domain-containing protein [Mucilaginibacter frigoritolerans]TWJ04746.1 HPt (histidine-containing phosphotransfer) domain-containing protein [Mucilaginibacter frigoritolerans]